MYCVLCSRERTPGEWSCSCGSDQYSPLLTHSASPPEVETCLRGPLSSLVIMPRRGTLLLSGPKGVGKTTLGLLAFERPALITTEMNADQVVRYAQRLGVRLTGVAPPLEHPDPVNPDQVVWAWPYNTDEADGLIMDSVNGMADAVGFWRWARGLARERGLPLIVIAQVTTEGGVRSGTTIPHEVDVVVRLEPAGGLVQIHAEKCRFGGNLGSRLWNLRQGEVPKRLYVVTGTAPNYRLESWPWVQSDVYDQAELGKLTLPEAPVAVAARYTRLLGWVEPPDVEARREFARNSGIPYFTPGEP